MSIKQLKNRVSKLKPSTRQTFTLTHKNPEPPAHYDPALDLLVVIDLDGWSRGMYGNS
jgi:hypothetical protein